MVELSRSEQLLAEKTICILLLNGVIADGNKVYAYVAVRADQLEAFMTAQQLPGFILESHALVLASGIGEPSQEVQEMMRMEYGFNNELKIMLSKNGNNTV